MAVIKYDELFDFPGYNKAIKDAETANKDFGKTITEINTRIAKQYNEIKTELGEFTGILKNFNVNQRSAGDSLIRTGDSAVSAAKKMAEQRRIMNELVGTTDLTTRAVNELKTGLKGLEAEYSSIAGRSDDARAKKAALAAEARRLKAALKEEADMLKASTRVLAAAEGSYQSLQNEMAAIGRQLKAMPDAFDKTTGKLNVNNKAAVDLQTRYLQLNTTLKTADATLGNYQRNVGNYSSAFSGLGNSVNQLTRELPALGINMQTFFLAISNNLPILFDQLRQTKTEIAGLKAEGKAAPTVLGALGKAFFSLGTLLSVGVTLLTLFGHKIASFIGGLFKGKSALTEFQKVQALTNEITEKGTKGFAAEAASLDIVRRKLNDVTIPAAERVKIAKQYNETAEKANQIDLAQIDNLSEINNKIASQISLIKQRGLARAAENIIAEKSEALLLAQESAREKSLKTQVNIDATAIEGTRTVRAADGTLLKFGVTETERNLNRQKEIADRITKDPKVVKAKQDLDRALQVGLSLISPGSLAGTDAKDKDAKGEDLIKKQQERLKKLAELAIQQLELQQAKGLISEEEFQIKKLGIISKYADAAIELENKRGKKKDDGTIAEFNKERIAAETEYQNFITKQADESRKEDLERAKAQIKTEAELNAAQLNEEKEGILASKQLTDRKREALELDYQNRIDQIMIDSIDRRIALELDATKRAELEKEKLVLQTGIAARNRKADEKAFEAKYQAEINAAKLAFDIIKAGRDTSFKEELAFLEKLKAIKLKYAKETAEEENAIKALYAERDRQLREEMEATIIMGIEAGLQIAQDLSDAKFANRIANLEAEKQQELDAAGNNANARVLIEDKYNKKIAEQKRKQAQAEKNFALFNVAISTAQGVAKSIAEWGMPFALPFIALTLVQGAIQAAVIASRPIPKFKYGTDNSPEGFAIVDEEGPELIIDSKGRLKEVGGDQGPRYTYLERGSKVVPHGRSKQMLKDMEMSRIMGESSVMVQMSDRFRKGKSDEMAYAMTVAMKSGAINEHALAAAFEKAVKKVPKSDFFFDERGFRKRINDQGDLTTYLNKLTRM